MTSRVFSCFLDDDPILRAQAFIWVNCLKRVQDIDPSSIFVHVPAGSSKMRDWLSAEGVNIIEVERFDARNRYCNKLQQLVTFCQATTDRSGHDQIVLMDCDTAWVGKEALPLGLPVSACIVDSGNPPEPIVKNIFAASGLGLPDWWKVPFPKGPDRQLTDVNNCNGGLYIIARDFLRELAPCWRRWAFWCLDNIHLFKSSFKHADQMSFALAMRELNSKVCHLSPMWNYPTHYPPAALPDITPQILHYHHKMTSHMKLQTVGIPAVDNAIEDLNRRISGFISDNLLNAVFWDFRYSVDPELGSGRGSRGVHLESKRELLRKTLKPFQNSRIIDVGCGDLEVTRHLSLTNYLGLDVSAAALRIAQDKRPDWTFRVIQPDDGIPEGDVVICIDVLIHQPDERHFLDLIGRLAAAVRRRLIVTGYEDPPIFASEITRYYSPVTEALRRTGAFSSVEILGRYRDVVVVAADKMEPETISACHRTQAQVTQR
jgi:SAM-dependent methyltransferase